MNIAILQSFLPTGSPHGGVGNQAHLLANHLVSRGHRVTMLSRDPRPPDARYEHRLFTTPSLFKHKLMRAAEGHFFPLRMALEDLSEFDVLHAHGDNAYLLHGRRPPTVRTFHGSAVDEAYYALVGPKQVGAKQVYWAAQQLSYYPLEWLGGMRAEVNVGISSTTKSRLPFVEFILGEAVNVERFQRAPGAARSVDPVVLFVGSMAGRKRGTLLVDAFKRHVLPVLPKAQLWMVCEKTGEDGNVRFLGRRPNAELPPLFHQAWAFCLPSSYEGFGIPYIEAMAAGLPVVATPNPGAREVLQDGRSGLLVSDEELGPSLLRVLTDANERARLEALGPARAADFSLATITERYEALYQVARDRYGKGSKTAA